MADKKRRNGKPAPNRKQSGAIASVPYDLRPPGARIKGRVGAPRAGLYKPERRIYLKRCSVCEEEFPSFRRNAALCSARCRQRRSRALREVMVTAATGKSKKKGGKK